MRNVLAIPTLQEAPFFFSTCNGDQMVLELFCFEKMGKHKRTIYTAPKLGHQSTLLAPQRPKSMMIIFFGRSRLIAKGYISLSAIVGMQLLYVR